MAYTKDSLWKTVDWWTILLYLILITCGWFSVCGASYDYGEPNFLDFTTRAGKQLMWIGCSLGLGFVLLMLEHRLYDTYAYLIYGILLLLLFGTIFNPHEIKGSRSWIVLGPVSLQPAEFAKFATALALAKFMASRTDCLGHHPAANDPDYPAAGNRICPGLSVILPCALPRRYARIHSSGGNMCRSLLYRRHPVWRSSHAR